MIYIIQTTDLKIVGGKKIQNIYINPFFYEKHNIMDEKKIPSTQRCKQWTQSSSQTIDIKEINSPHKPSKLVAFPFDNLFVYIFFLLISNKL